MADEGATLKVLVLTTDAYGTGGGIAAYNRDLIAAIADHDHVAGVTVVALNCAPGTGEPPEKVRLVGTGNGGKLGWVLAAVSQAGRRFDLVICGHVQLLAVAAALNLLWRAPLVLMVHGIEVWADHASRTARHLLRRVTAVWSVSRVTRDRLTAWSGFDPARVAILPNAVRLDTDPGAEPANDHRARLGLDGRKVLMTVARLERLERYKGIDRVIATLPALIRDEPSLVYLVVGDGRDRPYLEVVAARHGVAEHVNFTGHVDEETKTGLYRLADVFVMPGTGEGFGFVYLEAMAQGVPTIGSLADGSRDALCEGSLGQLVDPGAPEQIEAAVRRALAMPRGVPPGLRYFAWPNFVARVGAAMAAVLDRKTRG